MIVTVSKIINEFDLVIGNMVPDVYNHVAIIITPCLLGALTLAIILFGFKTMMGQIQNSREIYPLIWRMLVTIILIGGWGEITRLVYFALSDSAMWIGGQLMDAVSGKFDINHLIGPIKGIDSLTIALDQALIVYKKIAATVFGAGGWHDISAYLYGIVIYLFGYGIIMLGLLEILMAKFAVAFLFILLPIMAIFVVFGKTEKLFERHMGLLVGFALQLFFVPAVIGFALAFVKWSLIIGGVINMLGKVMGTDWSSLVGFVFVAFLGLAFVFKAAQWAQQIGSGFASGSGLGMLAAGVGGMMTGIFAAKKFLKPAGYPIKHPKKTLKGSKIASKFTGQMAMKTARLAARLYNAA